MKIIKGTLIKAVPILATAVAVSSLYGGYVFAGGNQISAEDISLGDTLTIGAGYYEEDTTIIIPSVEEVVGRGEVGIDDLISYGDISSPTTATGKYYNDGNNTGLGVELSETQTEADVDIEGVTELNLGINEAVTLPAGYYSDNITIQNNIKNNGALNKTGLTAGSSFTIPEGYTTGGTITAESLSDQTSGTATADKVLSGYTAWVNGSKITGTIANGSLSVTSNNTDGYTVSIPARSYTGESAQSKNIPYEALLTSTGSSTDKNYKVSIAANGFTGTSAQSKTIPWLETDDLTVSTGSTYSALNAGGTVKIPTGKYTGQEITVTAASLASQTGVDEGKTAAAAAQILTGYQAWVNGSKVTGSMANRGNVTNDMIASDTWTSGYYSGNSVTKKTAQTYTPGTSNQTISANQFLTGDQTIKGDSNLVAANIKKDVSIFGVTGTYSGAGATAQQKTVSPTTSTQTITPDSGYDYLSNVTVNAISTQSKSATPSTSSQTITPDSGKYLSSVSISAISTQSKSATPGYSSQTIYPDSGKYLSSVSVSGDTDLVASNIKSGVNIFGVTGSYTGTSTSVSTQTKTVTPTTSSQTVYPDSGKYLSSVTVNAIPNQQSASNITLDGGSSKTYSAGYYPSSWTVTSGGSSQQVASGSVNMTTSATATVTCGFKPSKLLVILPAKQVNVYLGGSTLYFWGTSGQYDYTLPCTNVSRLATINDDGFTMNKAASGYAGTWQWYAWSD